MTPRTGYEPIVPPISGDMPAIPALTRTSFCSTTTSTEHVMTVPSSTNQCWEKRDEHRASPPLMQEREASDARARVYHPSREDSMHPASWVWRDLVRENCLVRTREKRVENRYVRWLDRPFTKDEELIERETLNSYSIENFKLWRWNSTRLQCWKSKEAA